MKTAEEIADLELAKRELQSDLQIALFRSNSAEAEAIRQHLVLIDQNIAAAGIRRSTNRAGRPDASRSRNTIRRRRARAANKAVKKP